MMQIWIVLIQKVEYYNCKGRRLCWGLDLASRDFKVHFCMLFLAAFTIKFVVITEEQALLFNH